MREITHLHFPAWPDFGTPAQPSHLLALVELANVMQRAALPVETASIVGSRKNPLESTPIGWFDEPESNAKTRPMLIHCSAGCGRTGTFCTVDSVIDMLKRKRQTNLNLAKSQDAEGDISMSDDGGDISPTTTREMSFQFTQSPSVTDDQAGKSLSDDPNIDTKWLHDATVDLIQETVEDFREQRLSMVQSLRQFVLCYETVLEWIQRLQERSNNSTVHRRSSSLQQHP
jgi:protein-tyrosine phosphatase